MANRIESSISDKNYCINTKAPKALSVTCYGSSSNRTPERYLREARLLGYILAKRGHVCINGAGSFGCMAAMNDGVHAGEGHVRGVVHEMFLADFGYFADEYTRKIERKGSSLHSHKIFENAVVVAREEYHQRLLREEQDCCDGDLAGNSNNNEGKDDAEKNDSTFPNREVVVAGGKDLQERKKFLVANTDALIVLPGGPGTWDELWEMACERHLQLHTKPIVCVNVDGYYEPFRQMLERAWADKLIKHPPHTVVEFAASAEDAVRYVEGLPMTGKGTLLGSFGSNQRWKTLALVLAAAGIAVAQSVAGRGRR